MNEDITDNKNSLNKPVIDTDFESIVPWNGEHDTGYDARKKLDRNFERVKNSLIEVINFFLDSISSLDKRFLRKDQEDETQYLQRLLGGIKIGKHLTIGDFITGVQGGYIDDKGRAELESLSLRGELLVPSIRYNYMTYFEGYNLITPGGGLMIKEFIDNDDGSWTVTPDLEDAQTCSQFYDDILTGFWYDATIGGEFAGFHKMQFRVVSVDYTAKKFVMVPRPDSDSKPYVGLKLGQTGNFSIESRQTYQIFDTRDGNNCLTFFDNANTWDPEPNQQKSWFGKKKGMIINGISTDNYSAVLQNIIMSGLIFQVDEITGDMVRVPIDMGDWDATREDGYAYYMRVSYPGGLWLCVNPDGTKKEPGINSVDWLLQVKDGEAGTITPLGEFASHPDNPFDGAYYYNTVDRCSYLYSGGVWTILVKDGKDGKDYEFIYIRTNVISLRPEKPDSVQEDGYIPEGWSGDFAGVDEEHQIEWACKRNRINGIWSEWTEPAPVYRWAKDGQSPVFADLDNEMVNCRLTSGGFTISKQTWTTNVAMYLGTDELDISDIEVVAPDVFSVVSDKITRQVTISVEPEQKLSDTNIVLIKLSTIVNGQINVRNLRFIIAGVRDGVDGQDAVMYSLQVSDTIIKKNSAGTFSVEYVSCRRIKTVGDIVSETEDGELKCSIDGGDEVALSNNESISVELISNNIKFLFYVDGDLVDTESVPLLIDGKHGDNGTSIESIGRWELAKLPVKANCIVEFAGDLFLSLLETYNPPYPIARFKNGNYRRKRDGGYILAGNSANKRLNEDWRLFLKTPDNPVFADLDNEMVSCRLDSKGIAVSAQSWITTVTMWYGSTKLGIDSIYYNSPVGFSILADKSNGQILVSVESGTVISDINNIDITVIAKRSGVVYSRELRFTIAGVRDGATGDPGKDAVLYSLLSSTSHIKVDKSGAYDTTYVSCRRIKTVGSDISDTTDGTLRYTIDGGNEIETNNDEQIPVKYVTKSIKFLFYIDDRLVDSESVPVIVDGFDGKPGEAGSSIVPIGRWDLAKLPIKANCIVEFARGSYLSLVETYNPPYPIARFKNGNYRRKRDGGYILAGSSANKQLNEDWQLIVEAPDTSIVYTLIPSVNVINYTSTGSPSPSSVLVSCKQTVGDKTFICNSLYLVARKYNGEWIEHVASVQAQSISVPAINGYKQFAVRAYKTAQLADTWSDEYVAQITIGVAIDGGKGDDGKPGPAGAFPYDCGVYKAGETYVYNDIRRDKVIFAFDGIYYNFIVKTYGSSVTVPPSSVSGDSYWEAAQKFVNIATDTMFADGANIANFMFKNGVMRSQDETGGVANMILNGKTGYFHCSNADITGIVNATGGSFKNVTFSTAESGDRVIIDAASNSIKMMSGNNLVGNLFFYDFAGYKSAQLYVNNNIGESSEFRPGDIVATSKRSATNQMIECQMNSAFRVVNLANNKSIYITEDGIQINDGSTFTGWTGTFSAQYGYKNVKLHVKNGIIYKAEQ